MICQIRRLYPGVLEKQYPYPAKFVTGRMLLANSERLCSTSAQALGICQQHSAGYEFGRVRVLFFQYPGVKSSDLTDHVTDGELFAIQRVPGPVIGQRGNGEIASAVTMLIYTTRSLSPVITGGPPASSPRRDY